MMTTTFAIYLEITLSIVLGIAVGWIVGVVIAAAGVPVTGMSIYVFSLKTKVRLREELGSLPWLTGFIINKAGRWLLVDFSIAKKEHYPITDEQLATFQKSQAFIESAKKVAVEHPELRVGENETDKMSLYLPPENMVSNDLIARGYPKYGLYTSTQVYLFEMLRIATEKSNPAEFKILAEELSKRVENHKARDVGETTKFLQDKFDAVIKPSSDVFMKKRHEYEDKRIRLEDVGYVFDKEEKIRANKAKVTINIFASLVPGIVASILSYYYATTPTIPLLGSVLALLLYGMYGAYFYRAIRKVMTKPTAIHFHNIITDEMSREMYLHLLNDVTRAVPNPQIYNITAIHAYFANRKEGVWEFVAVLPNYYNDSFDFQEGQVGYKGYSWRAQVSPFVMLEIHDLLGDRKAYMFVGTTYHFANFARVFFDYNIFQHIINKTYLFRIGTVESQLEVIKGDLDNIKEKARWWMEYAMSIAQDRTHERRLISNESRKTQAAQGGGGFGNEQIEQYFQQIGTAFGKLNEIMSGKIKKLLVVLVVAFSIIAVLVGLSFLIRMP